MREASAANWTHLPFFIVIFVKKGWEDVCVCSAGSILFYPFLFYSLPLSIAPYLSSSIASPPLSFSFYAPGSPLMFLTFILRWIESHIWLIFKNAPDTTFIFASNEYTVPVSLLCWRGESTEEDWDADLEKRKKKKKVGERDTRQN